MSEPETVTIGGQVYAILPKPPTHVIGCDLGQFNDYTALTVIESSAGSTTPIHQVRHLDRWRGKPYTDLIPVLEGLIEALKRPGIKPTLVVDQTGVGVAVVDQIRAANLAATVIAISIHGGDRVNHEGNVYRVPKRDLVGSIAVTLQSQRLRLSPQLPLLEMLTDELGKFKVKIDPTTSHDSYSAWREGDHDDCVLSVALATWWAEREAKKVQTDHVVASGLREPSKWGEADRYSLFEYSPVNDWRS